MKRFWDRAEAVRTLGAFAVTLDGRPVRLPGGIPLRLETAALASAVAGEWQMAGGAKGRDMDWDDVPLTRLAGTLQLRIAPDPEPMILELARWAESDLLCYRADYPAALVAREEAAWQPWLDWAAARFGARLLVTTGVMHVSQPAEALAALAAAVTTQPLAGLAALGVMVPALGSLVLGLAVAQGCLEPGRAWAFATLDEEFQAEQWGGDDQSERKRAAVAAEVALAARFLGLSLE